MAVAPIIDRSGGPPRGVMGRQKETLCSREHQLVWYEQTFGFFFFPREIQGSRATMAAR